MKHLRILAVSFLALAASPALATAPEGCGDGGDYGEYIRSIESGAQGYSATNPGSTATGAYQMTIGTLQSLGYISSYSGPMSALFGGSNWDNVVWTGLDGIRSREQFMANQGSQDRAMAELTRRNLQSVAGTYRPGQIVNGIPLTSGGVAAAVHMLGAGGFRQWAASGFSPSGLNATHAANHNWTPEQYQNHIMNRVASGGCMDPSNISIGEDEIAALPEIFLMPWEGRRGSPVILPGSFASAM